MSISKSRLFFALLSIHTLMVLCTTVALLYTAWIAPWTEPLWYVSIGTLFAMYYSAGGVLELKIYSNDSATQHRLIADMPTLRDGFYPTPYLVNANLQTLFAAVGRPTPAIALVRELVTGVYPDGEVCRLDWSYAKCHRRDRAAHADDATPVVIVFHGLTGGSDDSNMHYVTQEITERLGWHVVIPVRRGCGEEATITVPKFYAYGGLEDTEYVVDYIANKMSGHPLLAVGISAGSNILANYLAVHGRDCRISGAVSIANGYCWQKGTQAIHDHHPVWDAIMSGIVLDTLYKRHAIFFDEPTDSTAMSSSVATATSSSRSERAGEVDGLATVGSCDGAKSSTSSGSDGATSGIKRTTIYSSYTASQVKPLQYSASWSASREDLLRSSPPATPSSAAGRATPRTPVDCVPRTIKRVGSQREVDEHISRRLHGFDSLEAFYRHQSCEYRLDKITVPTIFLNALDDPLAHRQNIPTEALRSNPNTLLITTACGGHLGWADGWFPFRNRPTWMDRFIVEALDSLLVLATERRHERCMRLPNGSGGFRLGASRESLPSARYDTTEMVDPKPVQMLNAGCDKMHLSTATRRASRSELPRAEQTFASLSDGSRTPTRGLGSSLSASSQSSPSKPPVRPVAEDSFLNNTAS